MTDEDSKDLLGRLERTLFEKYINLARDCENHYCQDRGMPLKDVVSSSVVVDIDNLMTANKEILDDLSIMLIRRDKLIGKDGSRYPSPTRGKLAGIIAFRLSKRHIIHMHPICIDCDRKCVSKFNNQFAVICALEYIKKEYTEIPKEIGKEIFYTLTTRHTNQETLGLVFDTLKHYSN